MEVVEVVEESIPEQVRKIQHFTYFFSVSGGSYCGEVGSHEDASSFTMGGSGGGGGCIMDSNLFF